ncbi:RICIN domain-containing protein [Streptomyces sp. NPDC057249]|uniref:RICIN domain-containing protein n=1 Tax=Streptomyces sp. NPDC057249 TaxID=3346067 RepID=UPI0036456BE0
MPELPKRNVNRPAGSRPAEPLRSNDASKLDSARAALARAIAAQRAEEAGTAEGAGNAGNTEAPVHGISPATPPRRRAFPRRARVLAAVVGVVAVAVVAGVAVTAGGGDEGSGRRADAPAEGPVRVGGGGRSPLPEGSAADPTASGSVTPSATASPSQRNTPGPGRSTASGAGSRPSSQGSGAGTDSATKPGGAKDSDSAEVRAFPLSVEASGKCLTGAGSGAQLLASPCDGSSAQSWSAGADGSLRQGGLCAAVTGTEDRTPVVLAGCDRSSAQRIGLSGKELRSASTGKCLDLFGGASGSQIVLWECNGRDNQRWHAA